MNITAVADAEVVKGGQASEKTMQLGVVKA